MKRVLLFCVTLIFSTSIFAQSPYELHWKSDSYIWGSAITSSALALYLTSQIKPLSLDELHGLSRNDVWYFDRSATRNFSDNASNLSDYTLYGCLAAPLILTATKNVRSDAFTIVTMYAEMMAFNYSISGICKGAFQRNRPFVYNESAPEGKKLTKEARESFFSGHTMTAFAAAAFFSSIYSEYYPDSKARPYVVLGAFGLAAYTGYLRFQAGMHYQSDILVGAVIGTVLGYGIPALHKAESEDFTVQAGLPPQMIAVRIAL